MKSAYCRALFCNFTVPFPLLEQKVLPPLQEKSESPPAGPFSTPPPATHHRAQVCVQCTCTKIISRTSGTHHPTFVFSISRQTEVSLHRFRLSHYLRLMSLLDTLSRNSSTEIDFREIAPYKASVRYTSPRYRSYILRTREGQRAKTGTG